MRLTRSAKFLSAIVLVGALSLVTGVPMIHIASAQSSELIKQQGDLFELPTRGRSSVLPKFIAEQVRQDLSRRARVPLGKLRIRTAQKRTWKNSCLELASPGEVCGQSLVEGWRVVVTGNRQTWVYHTDRQGRILRIAEMNEQTPLASVESAIFSDLVNRSNVPRSSLRTTQIKQQIWSDGCLGLAEPDEFCTLALVPGWLVTVESSKQRWVYHSDQSGKLVKLNRQASGSLLKPVQMPLSELPPALQQSVIFRAIASGGFTGQTQQTILLKDGRLIRSRINPNGTASTLQTTQISPQQMRQFQQAIERMGEYDRLSYPTAPGSADFITVTLSTHAGTVQYSDSIQSQLPQPLQTMISAWKEIDRAS
ncbi:hypothetical protein [Phormidesmis priestleyi]